MASDISNNTQNTYQKLFSFEQRFNESSKNMYSNPKHVAVYIEKSKNSKIEDLNKHKFLICKETTVGFLVKLVRERLQVKAEKGIYLYVGNTIPTSSSLIGDVYDLHHDADGFLYLYFDVESTFG
jgi:GABA(A) receptor-associated protein